MSYAVGPSKPRGQPKGGYSAVNDDEESLANPLISGNAKRQKQVIETQMQQIQQKIKQLDEFHRQLGTEKDNHAFRQKVQQLLVQTGNSVKTCGSEIRDFGDLQVPQAFIKQKRDQMSAFQQSQKSLVKKLQDIGLKITEKQKLYADMAIQSAKMSMVSNYDENATNDVMVSGQAIIEENQNVNYGLQKEQIQIKGEVDFMENIIQQRKEDISNIANIMSDINSIAKDIAVETQEQGEKLARLDENMHVADRNASEALDELNQAQVYQKKSGKCMYFLVSIIVVCLIIMGIFLATAS